MAAELWKDTPGTIPGTGLKSGFWQVVWSYLLSGVLGNSNYHAMCSLSLPEVCSFLIGHDFSSRDRCVLPVRLHSFLRQVDSLPESAARSVSNHRLQER